MCNAAGKLIADVSAILENPPTEDEANKAPTSEWAFDHDADANAHHAKFTAAESRAAINNIIDANGYLAGLLRVRYYGLIQISLFQLQNAAGDSRSVKWTTPNDLADTYVTGYESGPGNIACRIFQYNGTAYEQIATHVIVDSKILTHKNISDAHHAKYTDGEAQAACRLDGALYWSCPGSAFKGVNPDSDQVVIDASNASVTPEADGVIFIACVNIPNGATLTGAIVYGDAGAGGETYTLRRVNLSTLATAVLATANINTEDTSIDNPVINNSTYAYHLYTSSLDIGDTIYGARITFTL